MEFYDLTTYENLQTRKKSHPPLPNWHILPWQLNFIYSLKLPLMLEKWCLIGSNMYFFENLPWFCFTFRNNQVCKLYCIVAVATHILEKQSPTISCLYFFSPFLMRSQTLILNFFLFFGVSSQHFIMKNFKSKLFKCLLRKPESQTTRLLKNT